MNLSEEWNVQLFIYQNSFEKYEATLREELDKFQYAIILPHFNEIIHEDRFLLPLKSFPKDKLIILDKKIESPLVANVYQDFRTDIRESLFELQQDLSKYESILLILKKDYHLPDQIKQGFTEFHANAEKIKGTTVDSPPETVNKGTVYICPTEDDLIHIIQLSREQKLELGKDIGIISYNETPVKAILSGGITVFSCDFEYLGKISAELMKTGSNMRISALFKIFKRSSI